MKLDFTPQARRQLQDLSLKIKNRIEEKIDFYLTKENPLTFAKYLGESLYRFRVGDYRIIFYIDQDTIYVVKVGRRDKIYK